MKLKLLLVLCFAAVLLNAGDLLPNGNFSTLTPTKLPAGWSLTGSKPGIIRENKANLLSLTTQLRHNKHKVSFVCKLADLPGGTYKVTGLVKGGVERFYLAAAFSQGIKPRLQVVRGIPVPEKSGWQKFTFSVNVPAGNKNAALTFEVAASKAGTVFLFRDFSMVRSTAAAKPAAKPAAKNKAMKISADLVARPAAAVNVVWPKFNINGNDWHLMLGGTWRRMNGLSHEQFVRGAGWGEVGTPFVSSGLPRKTGVREIEIWQGGKNVAPRAKLTFSSSERQTIFHHPEYFNDGKKGSCAWIIGSLKDFRYSTKGVPFQIDVELPDSKPVEKVVIHTLSSGQPVAQLTAHFNGREQDVFTSKSASGITLKFSKAPAVRKFRLTGKTRQQIYRVQDLDPQLLKAIGNKPFTHHHFKFRHRHTELSPENIDRDSLDAFYRKHPNFIPETVAEITANFYQQRVNPVRFRTMLEKQGAIVSTFDRNRYEAAETLRKNYERYVDIFGTMNVLEGGLPTMPYYYEWGAGYCSYEAMNERANWSNRFALLFGRSGSRQYNRPWGFYQTVYGEGAAANSRYSEKEAHRLAKIKKRFWHPGEDFGCSPSYTKRIIYYAYYCGTNMQHFESEPYGYAKHDLKKNTWSLTGHGRSIKDLYDWTVRKEGKRGEFYAPILLLTDYYSANWEMKNYQQWNVWYMYPYQESDYMYQHLMNTVDPRLASSYRRMKDHPVGMRNSEFGDLYDSFFGNAPSGAVTTAELGKYPVVFVIGSLGSSNEPAVAANLQKYVRQGGTLVINVEQMKMLPESFAGVKLSREYVKSGNMKIMKITPAGAEVVLKDPATGLPLVTRFRNGRGSVVLTTPYWLLDVNNHKRPLPIIPVLLRKIQQELLPVGIEGDIQFCFNKMADKTWKLILFNNKGTFKPTMRTREEFFPEYARKVTLTLPAGATAVEQRLKLPVEVKNGKHSLTVPPGEIAVVELKNVDFSDTPIDSTPITRKPSNAGGDISLNPEKLYTMKAGESGTHTDTVKKGNALYYNGKSSVSLLTVSVPQGRMPEGGFSCFAKAESTGGKQVVMTNQFIRVEIKGGRWTLWAYDKSNFYDIYGPKAEAGKWTHLAVFWKNSTLYFYVDGKEVESPTGPVILSGSISNAGKTLLLYLGSHYYARQTLFKGLIRDVNVFGLKVDDNKIKTEAEGK